MLSVHAHKESVLSLDLSEDGDLLFSTGGDSVVNVRVLGPLTGCVWLTSAGLVDEDICSSLFHPFAP